MAVTTEPVPASRGAERRDFEIVPRKGLVIVAVVFALLVGAIMWNELWPLEFAHIAGGATWMVVDVFMGFVIGPTMRSMPLAARLELIQRLMPKVVVIIPAAVTVTLASGWQLGSLLAFVHPAYVNHPWIVASYVVVSVMAVVALGLLAPANIGVLVELKKPRPNPVVIKTLMRRFVYAAGFIGAMQLATMIAMTKVAVG